MLALLLVLAIVSVAVALTREVRAQAVALGVFGLLLAGVFFASGAVGAGVCELALGGVALPLLVLAVRERGV